MGTKQKSKDNKKIKKKTGGKKEDKNLVLIKELKADLDILKDKNMKLLAEFDNFQKRTLIEKDKLRKLLGDWWGVVVVIPLCQDTEENPQRR